MRFRPLGSRLLVKQDDFVYIRPSGLVLPDTAGEVPQSGVVMAVGDGCNIQQEDGSPPLGIQVGSHIAFSKYGPARIKLPGTTEELLIVNGRDVLGALEEID